MLLPKNQSGAVGGWPAASFRFLRLAVRRQDSPFVYGPPTTIYNRFRRFELLAHADPGEWSSRRQHDRQSAPLGGGRRTKLRRRRLAARAEAAKRQPAPSSNRTDAPSPSKRPWPARRRSLRPALSARFRPWRRLIGNRRARLPDSQYTEQMFHLGPLWAVAGAILAGVFGGVRRELAHWKSRTI